MMSAKLPADAEIMRHAARVKSRQATKPRVPSIRECRIAARHCDRADESGTEHHKNYGKSNCYARAAGVADAGILSEATNARSGNTGRPHNGRPSL